MPRLSMSHNFKRPSSIDPQERREERDIALYAMAIENQDELDKLLADSSPAMREAMLERLTPHLRFVPDPTADCPGCGLRRGSVISHQCLVN